MAFDPTNMPRIMKGVYGFHSLLFGLTAATSVPAGDRRKGFGMRLAQNDGVATLGSEDVDVSACRL